jgi:hypothetical protein
MQYVPPMPSEINKMEEIYPGQDKAHRVSAGCGMLREIAL